MSLLSVIIVSDSKNETIIEMTKTAIESLQVCGMDYEVIVVETNEDQHNSDDPFMYDGAKMMWTAPGDFVYNRALNFGVLEAKGDYLAFCNNDLIFYPEWASTIVQQMEQRNIYSASPWCAKAHGGEFKMPQTGVTVGWKTRKLFAGWCFMWSRELYDKLGGLRENFEFWCSDNETVKQLEEHGEQHMLVKTARVDHLVNGTLDTVDPETKNQYTVECARSYNHMYNENIFNLR